jgi:thiaminase/transcriptional activator TenA
MAAFHETLTAENTDLLERARNHPFKSRIATGEIPDEKLNEWIQQEYLLVRAYEQFISALAARAPSRIRRSVFESVINFQGEIELFEQFAARKGVDLSRAEVNMARHSLSNFLLATVRFRTFPETIAACYGANLAHTEGLSGMARSQTEPSPWWEGFIEVRNQDSFVQFVGELAKFTDAVAEEGPDEKRREMSQAFRLAIRYVLAYWDSLAKEAAT